MAGNEVEEPDIHLILEYPSGASWGQYTSCRANRCVYIVHCCVSVVNSIDVWTGYVVTVTIILKWLYFSNRHCVCMYTDVQIFISSAHWEIIAISLCSADILSTVMTITLTCPPWRILPSNLKSLNQTCWWWEDCR